MITSAADGAWGNLRDGLARAELPDDYRVFKIEDLGEPKATRAEVIQRAVHVRVSDPAFMLYTSGTSANPKACVITNESITRQAQSLAEINLTMTTDDCLASPLPLFHIAGLAIYAASLHAGAKYCHSSFMTPEAAAEQLAARASPCGNRRSTRSSPRSSRCPPSTKRP